MLYPSHLVWHRLVRLAIVSTPRAQSKASPLDWCPDVNHNTILRAMTKNPPVLQCRCHNRLENGKVLSSTLDVKYEGTLRWEDTVVSTNSAALFFGLSMEISRISRYSLGTEGGGRRRLVPPLPCPRNHFAPAKPVRSVPYFEVLNTLLLHLWSRTYVRMCLVPDIPYRVPGTSVYYHTPGIARMHTKYARNTNIITICCFPCVTTIVYWVYLVWLHCSQCLIISIF